MSAVPARVEDPDAVHVERLRWHEIEHALDDFVELLTDALDHGASLGFHAPLARDTAGRYWLSLHDEIRAGSRVLVAARAAGRVVGTGQLLLPALPAARHRAEVHKLVVHSRCRGGGIGRSLMDALHGEALARGRTLIVLGTRSGGRPVAFYQRLGYRIAGVIPRYMTDADGRAHDRTTLYLELAR
jgi:ribosomal protein S18 acetylase RimI-like enzyme